MMARKKSKWARKWATQTELGARFGVSAVDIGRHLTTAGPKDGSNDTPEALQRGLATTTAMSNGITHTRWSRHKMSSLLEVRGLSRIDPNEARATLGTKKARPIADEVCRLYGSDDGLDQKAATLTLDALEIGDPAMFKLVKGEMGND